MRRLTLPLHLPAAALVLVACGDDGTMTTGGMTEPMTSGLTPGTTPGTTSGTTTDDPTTAPLPTSGTTEVGSATEVVTSTTDALTSTDPSSTSTGPDPSTSTGPDPSSTGTTDVSGTTMACVCTPGEAGGCEGDQQLVCADDCLGFEPAPCPNGQTCVGDACSALFCNPGKKECVDGDTYQQCNGEGSDFDPPVDCAGTEGCAAGDCVALCLIAEAEPSTVGCSFFASRMDNFNGDETDSLVLGNTSKTKNASVQLYFTPNGSNVEQAQGAAQNIAPGGTVTFQLTNAPFDKASGLRKGGSYRVQSTIPIVAYQHSPIGSQATNDASVLFPEHALRQNYVIASYKDDHNAYPSYFTVIARDDGTTVKWTPSQSTLAGNGVAAVAAGQTGQVAMNRFDTLQVRAPFGGDLSGTQIESDKPIWVVGAVECVNVPNKNVTFCDHIEEQMLALDYWGKKYVGAHSPKRGNEKHYWRVYGGEDGTTITTNPAQPGTPFMLNKGQWKELVIANNTSFIFEGDKPFLPVQYLESQDGGAGTGDPAMYQMIPVEQFLDRYAFATGTGYNQHYVQVIRSPATRTCSSTARSSAATTRSAATRSRTGRSARARTWRRARRRSGSSTSATRA
jgi:hypothetical protein